MASTILAMRSVEAGQFGVKRMSQPNDAPPESRLGPTARLLGVRRRPLGRVVGVAAVPIIVVLVIALTLHSRAATSDSPTTLSSSATKPTIVLVHGALSDASTFRDVTSHLQHGGYTVVAAANPERGVSYDAAYLRSVLDTITGPVVLVGHSYAGAVISNAAAGDPNVRALVFVAAFLPEVGETLGQANAGSKDSILDALHGFDVRPYPTVAGGTAMEAHVKPDLFPRIFAQDLPASLAAVLAASQRPIDVSAFGQPSKAAAWKTIPSWCMVPLQDHGVGTDAEMKMAERAHCHIVEVSGSHFFLVVKPDAVSKVIEEAVTATSR
jgi:pimeloyl-ACP methyl ester carboxylesterase